MKSAGHAGERRRNNNYISSSNLNVLLSGMSVWPEVRASSSDTT